MHAQEDAKHIQPLQCGLLRALAEPSPHPPHTRGTFHRRLQPLHTEKHKVSCSGFLPQITMPHATFNPVYTQTHHIAFWPNPARTRRTHEVPFIAGCSHFTRKNTRVRAPAFSPNQTPCNIHAAFFYDPHAKSTLLLSIFSHFSLSCNVNSQTTLQWV